ncbi:MAG: prepilin-type N-terminal cleavage/methylation domain-containing protein [Rickettsiales bacterium]|nr:prepilin-type N-terminal cleavage/methylation domain-containing protein [Rickettsiales bacterium]
MKKPYSKAFTLLELAFVILIIGIFVAGVMSAKDLVKKSKLANARALTESSPVAGTSGLKIWVETTLDNAISPNTNLADGTAITQWNDINPQSKVKYNLTAGSSPSYKEFGIGDLPSLTLRPSSYLNIPNCKMFNNSNYTVFIVDMPTTITGSDEGVVTLMGGNLSDGTNSSSNITLNYYHLGYSNKYNAIVFTSNPNTSYSYDFVQLVPHIHTLRFDSNEYYNPGYGATDYWVDGGVTRDAQKTGLEGTINNCYSSYIGKSAASQGYNGYISEFIIFNRALSDDERQAIETYLSKKYNIKIS